MSLRRFILGLPSIIMQELSLLILSILERKPIFFTTKWDALPKIGGAIAKRRLVEQASTPYGDYELGPVMEGNLQYLRFLWNVLRSEFSGLKLASVK